MCIRDRVLAMYKSMDAADEGNLDLAPFPRLNVATVNNDDGSLSITGTPSLDNQDLSGLTVYFRLEADDGTSKVVSDMYQLEVPALASGNSVDMAPTPVSFSTQNGFPPITRAVINSVAEIPAVHDLSLIHISEPTRPY